MSDLCEASAEAALSEGWYEFITPVTAMTKIAYVYESGSVYLPDSDQLDWEHATDRHKLVRADAVVTVEAAADVAYFALRDAGEGRAVSERLSKKVARATLALLRGGEER